MPPFVLQATKTYRKYESLELTDIWSDVSGIQYRIVMIGAKVYIPLIPILESEILMENRNRSDGSVGSDVGTDNAEICLVTANIL